MFILLIISHLLVNKYKARKIFLLMLHCWFPFLEINFVSMTVFLTGAMFSSLLVF